MVAGKMAQEMLWGVNGDGLAKIIDIDEKGLIDSWEASPVGLGYDNPILPTGDAIPSLFSNSV